MKRLPVLLVVFGLLFLGVPWLFIGSEGGEVAGLPAWVFYVVVMSLVFAVVTAFTLGHYWADFEGGSETDKQEDREG